MKDLDKLWMGIVEENKDPDRLGRIKVRVQGLYDVFPTEDIPWSSPYKNITGKYYEVPAIGKIVSVLFPNQSLYEPYYIFANHYNTNLGQKLKDLSEDEYVNFISLVFDERTKVYSDDNSLTMDYKYNKMTIDNENINMELKDNSQKVNIGCKTAEQQAVLGNHWFDWMDDFINALVKPSSLMGNSGAPVLKSEIDQLCMKYKKLRDTFVSDNVYIVDNKKVEKLEMKYNSPIADDGVKINDTSILKNPDKISANTPAVSVGEGVKEKIKEQKEQKLEEVKASIPSDTMKKEESNDDAENFGKEQGDKPKFYEVKDGDDKEITEEEYNNKRKKEAYKVNMDTYEIVDEQQDADDIIINMEYTPTDEFEASDPDDISLSYDPNSKEVYSSPDFGKYVDKTDTNSGTSNVAKSDAGTSSSSTVVFTGKAIKGKSYFKCSDIKNMSLEQLYGLRLSEHYTVRDLTLGAMFSHALEDLNGYDPIRKKDIYLTKYQIVCNLQRLAINCLEPMYNQFSKYGMKINSCLRTKSRGEYLSQHEMGEAADVRFDVINSKKDMNTLHGIATWMKDNSGISYRQFILEYSVGIKGTGWIHTACESEYLGITRSKYGTRSPNGSNVYVWNQLKKYSDFA